MASRRCGRGPLPWCSLDETPPIVKRPQTLFAALRRYPLVAVAERHMLREWHDFITALLFHPDPPRTLTDIVVEFGCSSYQAVADRFILTNQPVARADLARIRRQVGDLIIAQHIREH
ncbi:MAG TPA: hypothetical protein VNL71_00190 [Chloroflexota bacterium]|nr:hypothetical protein [Chloroflexota bacterium]